MSSGSLHSGDLLFHDPQSDELTAQLLAFVSDPFEASLPALDSLFDDDDDNGQTCDEASDRFLSSSSPVLNSTITSTLAPEFQYHEFHHHHRLQCPKRLRSCSIFHHHHHQYSVDLAAEVSSSVPPPLVSRCLSAQSVAARQRRRRISEKTQELGRLIPGGNRMNTADMFEAGYKYVKFLQAQVGILGLMASLQECKVAAQGVEEQLRALLAVAVIQERLYGEGRCMVPKVMVEAIVKDQDIRSNQLLFRDLNRFIASIG